MSKLEMANLISTESASSKANLLALGDLADIGIDPNSPAGREFLFRVGQFGIDFVQPPGPELNEGWNPST